MTDLDLTRIEPTNFHGFDKFEFDKPSARRNIRVDQVLPKQESLRYCVLITELFLEFEGRRTPVVDFDSLFAFAGLSRNPESLESIRHSLQLIEGSKILDKRLSENLICAAAGAEYLFIRCWYDPDTYVWKVLMSAYLRSGDLLDVLPNPFGEFEIADERHSWYLRLRDDDPFIFFAGQKAFVRDLATRFSKFVMEVPGSMIYSY